MRLSRILVCSLFSALMIFNISCTGSTESFIEITPDSSNVKLLGRSIVNNNELIMCFSGTGAAFNVNAKRLDVEFIGDSNTNGSEDLTNGARIVVFVNGERKLDKIISQKKETVTIFKEKKPVVGEVCIVKASESAQSLAGISKILIDKNGSVVPSAPKDLKIEFVGDSITCGYGIDDPVKEHHFQTSTEDNTKSYAYKTAMDLDADYSMVSASGFGVISGYTSNSQKNTTSILPKYYDKLGFTWGSSINGIKPDKIDWDFNQFIPDFVVINLGTNDNSYVQKDSDKTEQFKNGYNAFVKDIRSKNPEATIICALGMMGTDLCKAVEEMVEDYKKETGDMKIISVRFTNQNAADGIVADWHPSEKTHDKAALVLKSKIRGFLE